MHVLRKDPWLTDQGRLPMPENTHVDIEIEVRRDALEMRSRCARDALEMRSRSRLRAPLQESEIEAAVSSLGGAVSVVMAVNKMTRNVVSRRPPHLAHCARLHSPALSPRCD